MDIDLNNVIDGFLILSEDKKIKCSEGRILPADDGNEDRIVIESPLYLNGEKTDQMVRFCIEIGHRSCKGFAL